MPATAQPTVQVEIRDVYGCRTIYPVCENARTFAQIAGTKTLTPAVIKNIKDLGYAVVLRHFEVAL